MIPLFTPNTDTKMFWFVNFSEVHIRKKITIYSLLVVSEIRELGCTQTRVGLTVSLLVVVLEFHSDINREIPAPEAIQANSGKGNKQPVRGIRKMWTQEEKRITMECYYWSKPKIMGIDNKCMQYGETRVCLI